MPCWTHDVGSQYLCGVERLLHYVIDGIRDARSEGPLCRREILCLDSPKPRDNFACVCKLFPNQRMVLQPILDNVQLLTSTLSPQLLIPFNSCSYCICVWKQPKRRLKTSLFERRNGRGRRVIGILLANWIPASKVGILSKGRSACLE